MATKPLLQYSIFVAGSDSLLHVSSCCISCAC